MGVPVPEPASEWPGVPSAGDWETMLPMVEDESAVTRPARAKLAAID